MRNFETAHSNHNFINKMKNTIKQHALINRGDKIVIGVSGGADSVALLRALHALRSEYNLDLIVCHVNHKIRPGAAERDQRFVETLCAELGVACYVKEAHVESLAKEWKMSDEEAGRKVRYDFFNEAAGTDGKIATAHNKNDNAETVMMRFMRGAGLHGLTGIPYRRDNIIRPILDISRDEIEEFLKEIGQEHITDETNAQPIYTRNKIRLNLIPDIKENFNPNFIDTLSNNISNYREEDDYMAMEAEKVVSRCFDIEKDRFCIKNDAKVEHVAILKRAIKSTFTTVFDVELSCQAIVNIVSMLNKSVGTKLTVAGDVVATVQYDGIVLQHDFNDKKHNYNDKMMAEFNLRTNVDREAVVHTNNMTISYCVVDAENVVNNANTFYYPANLCCNGLKLRTRRNGDVIVIAPGMRKKLKKFFIDEKVNADDRDRYWLLVNDNNEIVWIPGLFGSRLRDADRSGKCVKFSFGC